MRLPFLTVSVLPVIFGVIVARAMQVPVNILCFILALAAAVLVHIGANVINDYFDFRNGTDTVNREFVHGFTGGSRAIQEGLLSHNEVLAGALVFLSAGFFITLYLAGKSGHPVLFMGTAAVVAAVTYSLFLHSVYIGELIVGLCFGTMIPAGSFYVQAGFVSPTVLLASVPMALLVFLILLLNEIPDYTADKSSGKNTLVVRLGRQRAASLYAVTLVIVYVYMAVTALALHLPLLLCSFLTMPVAFVSTGRLLRHYGQPDQLRPSIMATITLFTVNSLVLIGAFAFRGA
jgi:1,4-dihydroxy-2-naphthoate octaprenyltransferase